jgi:glutathione synthase/RimK-type ligase-like ATP-grasp enzyme
VGWRPSSITHDALERWPNSTRSSAGRARGHGLTYEFVRRPRRSGMPVVDDPESILKCVNKVYMHELMSRHRIAAAATR